MTPLQIFLFVALCLALAMVGYGWGWMDGSRAERLRCINALEGVHAPPMRLTRAWILAMLKPTGR